MELASDPLCEPSAPEANLHNEHLSLSDRLSLLETPLDSIVQEIETTESTERNSGLELKLDLYVPVPPIIEPITPVEETVEHCALPVATQEDTTQPEAVKEGTEEAANVEGIHCENQSSLVESSADTVTEVECEHASNETSSSDCTPESCVPVEPISTNETPKNRANIKSPNGSKVYNADRKNIPPKKDKFNPLKIDFSKVIPLTSSQLSLQCLECHIIFSDSKSKERHLKMSHPAEYQQCMLGDALFTCYVCDQHFSSSTELMTHQRTHTGNERFKCPFCSEAFYRSCELTSHKKQTHFSKHGYTCSECGKPFKTFTLLRYHQRVHTAEKPFVCIHKHCGRKFSASKSLQHHLEKHQKEDNLDDQTSASANTKKKRDKGKNEQKFPCSQCAAVFKTSKAQLLHIKNKHSQESQSSTLLGPQLKPPGPALTQTANGQPQTLIMETVGPAPQHMDKLDPEQIKRLIEKLGNVQKVNQLVILPLQPQSFGSPHPQPLMQPLHVNFTESTIQLTQCQKSDTDLSKTEQINIQSSEEIGDLQQREAVLSQKENFISSENSEAQITPVELIQTEVQTQMDEIHLELIPIQTETSVLLDQTPLEVEAPQNDSINEMAQIAEEHIPVAQDIAALETNNEPPLIPPMETVKSHHVEEASVPVDTVALEETVTNEEMPCPTQMLDSTELSVESESLVIIEQGDIGKLSQPQELQGIQAQKDQAESEKEPSIPVEPQSQPDSLNIGQNDTMPKEPQSQPDSLNIGQNDTMLMEPQSQPASLNTVQNDTMSMEPQSQPDSLNIGQNDTMLMEPQSQPASLNTVQNYTMPMEPQSQPDSLNTIIDLQQSSVLTPDQTTASLQDCPFVQKKIPAKKKRSKKQLVDKVETKEASKLCDGQVASTKKVNTSSKVITKKREKPKKKKLLVKFGPTEKKKSSKPKVVKPSKTKQNQNQQMTDQNQVPELSQHNNKLDFNQKVQKDKKGKGVESSSEAAMKTTGQMTTLSDTVLVEPEALQQVKPQKRKMKNQNNLDKKTNSVQEAHQDEALVPVQKKKKQRKTSVEECPKKPKVRKTQNDDLKKNTHKLPRHKVTKAKSRPDVSELAHIEKQALLLLKGHKQPQLKVHKLDATELEKSPPSKCDNKALKKTKKAQSKSLNVAHQKKTKLAENNLLEYQGEPLSFEMPSVENSPGSGSTKPKTVRKRKAPTKIDQEIALSPPYSQLTLGCQDCGKTFSEVSALQQHMASWHSAGKAAFPDETIDVAKKRVVRPGPKEKCIPSNVFEIQVATDWDMETEVGEIVGERLSFPALSPSPSLTLASGGVEGKEQEGDKDVEGIVSRLEQPPEQNLLEVCEMPSQDPTPALSKSIVPQELTENASENVSEQAQSNEVGSITETSCTELKDAAEDEIKEELPPEVNLVMVGEKNVEENHNTQIDNASGVSQELENEVTNSGSQLQESAKDNSVVSTQNVFTEPEIKQEEEEVLVRRVDEHKRVIGENSVTKGKKGVERSRGKKPTGRRTSMENRSKKNMEGNKDPQECQVLYHLCVLDTPEGKNKEKDKNGVDASESSQPSSSEEAPEEQVVFELDSVTTSVMDIVNSEDSAFEESRELVRDGSSPGIILEKFLTARERNMENPNAQSQIRACSTLDTSKVTSANTSADVKIEERSSNLAHHSLISSESGTMRGVQMVLVKAEEHLTTNEMFQALQPVDHHRVACQEKTIYRNRDGSSLDSHVVPLQSYSKQCIFYPVKEEEREHLVEPPQADQTFLNSGELAAVTPIGASSGIEECEEVRVGSVQMDVQHLYSTSEEGDANAEQQRTQGFLEFLSENSDTDDADNVHSEPEAETIVMSCYHGIQSNGTVHQNGREKCNPSGRVNVGASPTRHTEPERQLNWKPINYFNQYFSVDTWNEIAVCTRETSKLSNLVTEKEVAQYVGIHIAMGTLKFPSTKLYWEDCTRVPLISDAMTASRFCELTRKVKLANSGASVGMSSDQQSEERNRNNPGPSKEAHNNKEAHNCTNLKTDPLWKVMPLIKRVQDGCQALNRQGSYGVDQYPLPFQRHPTHSLLHTVVINGGGLVVDFSLSVDDSNREDVVKKMVSRGKDRNEGMVFLCKPELSTPSMLEHLLEAGVQSAGKVGGARGQIGDEFVSSDGKLKLFRCHHGFILSAVVKEKPRSTSLVSGFERAIKAANLNRDLRSLYRTPCTNSAVSAWPQSVLWDLIDLVLVNAWIQYKQDYSHTTDLLSLMAFRLEVAKALILSSGVDTQDSSPPCPPAPKLHGPDTNTRPSQVLETPLPDEHTRYDGFGHWPEQLAEGEEARRCRFGGCERTSRVRCLKCCVFLCISRNHNCFLKFHSQGSS